MLEEELESQLFAPGIPANEDTMAQASRIAVIKKLNDKIEQMQVQKAEAIRFYDGEMEKIGKQQEFLIAQVEAYLRYFGQKSLKTHLGGATIQVRQKAIWPDKAVVVDWAKQYHPELVKTEETVSLTDVKRVLSDSPALPGFSEETVESVIIR